MTNAYDFAEAQGPAERAYSADTRMSHVAGSLLAIDDEGQQLLAALRELESRLNDVLRPEQDVPADKMQLSEPRPALVALAERLTTQVGTIRMARQYVGSILDRLEL